MENLENECRCPMCVSLLRNPVVTKCGHYGCRSCFTEWFKQSDKCPTCNQSIEKSLTDVMTDPQQRMFKVILCAQEESCENEGCNWRGKYEKWVKHERYVKGGCFILV